VGFEAPAAESRLLIPSQSRNNEEIHIGLSWSEGSGKYKLSKVITLSPRFILRNNSNKAIVFREHGSQPRGRSTLQPGERTPLHFLRMGDEKMLTISFSGPNAQWYIYFIFCFIVFSHMFRSPPLNVEDLGSMHFRLKAPGSNEVQLLSSDVKLGGSTIFIVISDTTSYPFVIENDSDYAFTIYQSVSDHMISPTFF
jgi:vacuolar protein sorting-associated protein 13A/C